MSDFPKTTKRLRERPIAPGEERLCLSRYETRCRTCGEPIHIGEQIRWSKAEGARHTPFCRKLELQRWEAEAGDGTRP